MSESVIDAGTLFDVSASTVIDASPDAVYDVVSDLSRSAEWSPECRGGTWVSGEPREVGAVFRGENLRSEDVVAWAPLVRGTWYTQARVVAAEPGRTFRWMMLSQADEDQESIWGFDLRPLDGGRTELTHHFRMGRATAGIHKITQDLDENRRERFVDEWTTKLEHDLEATLNRIRGVVEKS